MRDVIGRMRWGMMGGGICGTDHLLEITPAGLPFLGPPPNPRRAENGNGKQPAIQKKKNAYF